MAARTSLSALRWFLPLLIACGLLARPATTSAHPLGNFTINLYSRVVVSADRVDVVYIVDQAEIPTFQAFGSTVLSPQAQTDYLAQTAPTLRDGLRLMVDGRLQSFTITSQALAFSAGQGGLRTSRIELSLAAKLPKLAADVQRAIAYEDTNYADRLGWHEIIVQEATDTNIVQTDVPAVDTSQELRQYPKDMLANPLDVRRATATIVLGTGTAPKFVQTSAVAARPSDQFAALINVDLANPLVLMLTLLAAMGLGAAHALSPGHGKTVVAAYLIGARGTARHAVFLGTTVTITHTLGVFVLGLITLYASHYILPEQLYPWLGVVSGALVIGMGVTLLRQRIRAALRPHTHEHHHHHDHEHTHDHHAHDHHHDHEHTHDHHAHDHHHDHEHGPHTHTHLPPGSDGSPVTWRSLLALGVSGGLVPCPSALVVMLSAIALGRVGLGLLLIVAFSVGLAAVLTAIGLVFVFGARSLQRFDHAVFKRRFVPVLRFVPVVGAFFVTTAGLLLTMQAALQTGLLR